MSVSRKENGSLVKKAGRALVDLALNRNSNKSIANSAVSNCLLDGIGNTNEKFRFGTDGQGNYGYIKEVEGADTFFPFKSIQDISYVLEIDSDGSSNGIGLITIPSESYKTLKVKCSIVRTLRVWGILNDVQTEILNVNTNVEQTVNIQGYDHIKIRSASNSGASNFVTINLLV